jgi:DNA-binding winged helix-turn-helix (wHTH) protein
LVFTRNQLLNRIWGDDVYDERLVDVHMAGLRKKIEDDPATPRYIETIWGVGFRFGSRSASPHASPLLAPGQDDQEDDRSKAEHSDSDDQESET